MSITASPVLARILQERRLEKTPLGVMAITCAVPDDVTAWSLLAFVVAIVRSTVLVIMALATTFLTGPLLGLTDFLRRRQASARVVSDAFSPSKF